VPLPLQVKAVYHRLVRTAYRDPIELGDLQVDGEDLAAAGVPKGPELGTTLRRLLDAVIEDPACNTRARLIEMARADREEQQ
jgi:tRNA nucleotidyltransferase (CCA-adding enzyme)